MTGAFLALAVTIASLLALSPQALAASNESPAGEVPQHHRDLAHSGLYVTPELTWETARHLHRDPRFQARLDGPVYAQPLYWSPADGKPVLIVATEQNLVYGLDPDTGNVIWKKSLGPPVPSSALPCGNIDPLGITGTPVIDQRSGTLYLDAMVWVNRRPAHEIFALSTKDGSVLPRWPVDVAAALQAHGKTFLAQNQNERGALTIVGDRLYVPYGGHFGDCATYHGWVVGVSLRDPTQVSNWSTRGRGGGIWAPGGIVSDGKALYASTGNTMGARNWADGEAVIRLGLDLSHSQKPEDFFAPANWRELDDEDLDLGGANPVLVTLPGATPSDLVLALGKDGKAYLLDRRRLGGIGGALAAKTVADGPIRTAPAAFPGADGAYVVFQGSGAGCPAGHGGDLTAVKISRGAPPALAVIWCAREHGRGSPIVTTTNGEANPIVWAVGAEGDNRLRGFRGDTGAVIFNGGGSADAMSLVRRFTTLIAVGRHLYVAGDTSVYAFTY
ncbi:MAG TPA: hypothetical protein VKY65_02080 [Alphaproteobacteria bacterium]|nr:hypothetical protein [Alphaproteobacteria bacterium]